MLQLRPGLFRLESARAANAYLLEHAGRVFLFDPGLRFQLNPLAREIRDSGRSAYDVTDIVLTHYDVDHAQIAAEWSRRTGAPVWLGAADAEILRTRVAPTTPFRTAMGRLSMPELPADPIELRGEIELVPGLRAIPAPGHTPGSYAFVWRDVALIGDAARTDSSGRLIPTPALLMSDVRQGDATRAALDALPVRLFCAGHTPPAERPAQARS